MYLGYKEEKVGLSVCILDTSKKRLSVCILDTRKKRWVSEFVSWIQGRKGWSQCLYLGYK